MLKHKIYAECTYVKIIFINIIVHLTSYKTGYWHSYEQYNY